MSESRAPALPTNFPRARVDSPALPGRSPFVPVFLPLRALAPAPALAAQAELGLLAWREQNLLQSFTALGNFDVVFIRNVLIYFDTPTKRDVLERIARQLHPGGTRAAGLLLHRRHAGRWRRLRR